MSLKSNVLSGTLVIAGLMSANGQNIDRIKYGDFSNWVTRNLKESAVIGGKEKTSLRGRAYLYTQWQQPLP